MFIARFRYQKNGGIADLLSVPTLATPMDDKYYCNRFITFHSSRKFRTHLASIAVASSDLFCIFAPTYRNTTWSHEVIYLHDFTCHWAKPVGDLRKYRNTEIQKHIQWPVSAFDFWILQSEKHMWITCPFPIDCHLLDQNRFTNVLVIKSTWNPCYLTP